MPYANRWNEVPTLVGDLKRIDSKLAKLEMDLFTTLCIETPDIPGEEDKIYARAFDDTSTYLDVRYAYVVNTNLAVNADTTGMDSTTVVVSMRDTDLGFSPADAAVIDMTTRRLLSEGIGGAPCIAGGDWVSASITLAAGEGHLLQFISTAQQMGPDVAVAEFDISVSGSGRLTKGELATADVDVFNLSPVIGTEVDVKFFLDSLSGTYLGKETVTLGAVDIDTLPQATAHISVSQLAQTVGPHDLVVQVVPTGSGIADDDAVNNVAKRFFFVYPEDFGRKELGNAWDCTEDISQWDADLGRYVDDTSDVAAHSGLDWPAASDGEEWDESNVSGAWEGLRVEAPTEDAEVYLNFRGKTLYPDEYPHLIIKDALQFVYEDDDPNMPDSLTLKSADDVVLEVAWRDAACDSCWTDPILATLADTERQKANMDLVPPILTGHTTHRVWTLDLGTIVSLPDSVDGAVVIPLRSTDLATHPIRYFLKDVELRGDFIRQSIAIP